MSTRFVTFYSYKGGVGRTMTLANVAAWLAIEAHKRVFLLDFDLEAPGLPYYAGQTPLVARLPAPGLVEYFTEYRQTATLPDLTRFVLSEPEDRLGGGRLMMMTAGRHGTTEYAQDLAALDWNALYETGFGFELFEHLRRMIAEQFQPDIVLVDSRTGLHGIGSIATQQLADTVVLMFGLNLQNIEGARNVLANIEENPYRQETGRDIQTLLVASPVYDEGGGLARDALRRAERVLGRRVDVRIPFSAGAVFEERLWPLDPDDAPRVLLQAYAELGARLVQPPAPPELRSGSRTFEALVARLFEIEGYTVTSSREGGYDLLAERDAFPSRERLAVQVAGASREAKRGAARLLSALDRSPALSRAVICTPERVDPDLRREVERDRRLAVVSQQELMQRLLPFGRYMESLVRSYEDDALSRYYEPLDVASLDGSERKASADGLVDAWLKDAADPHLVLLGDYGTGKTSFCRRLAARLARERRGEEEWTGRVPVLVSLRNYARALNVESLVNDLLSDRQRFASGSFAAFDLLNREGRLLILLDGFDEMATRADERIVLENYRELRRLIHPKSKVLLTCRTHYFQTRGQADSMLAGKLVEEARSSAGFRMVELESLREEQIERIVRRRAEDPEAALALIRRTYDLGRLAQRPVLLDLILTTVPKLAQTEGKLNAAKLYAVYTEEWITTDAWRSRLTPAQKERLMEALAVHMYVGEKLSVHYTDLRVFIREELGEQVATLTDLDHFDYDIRTCYFVNRDDSGNYRFMHRSFQEYFLAKHFARELTSGGEAPIFNLRPMPQEVALFLADMEDVTEERLLSETVKRAGEEERFGGGNAATVLALRGRLLEVSRRDLSGRDLRGAVLSDIDLSGVRFDEAWFDGAKFLNARMDSASFRGASFRSAVLGGGKIRRVSLGANGRFVVALDRLSGSVTVWDTSDGALVQHFSGIEYDMVRDAEAHATLPILAVLLTGRAGQAVVRTYDLTTGEMVESAPLYRCEHIGPFLSLHPERPEAIVSEPEIVRIPLGVAEATPVPLETGGFRGRRAVVTELGIAWMGEDGRILWFDDGAKSGTLLDTNEVLAYLDWPISARSNGDIWFAAMRTFSLSLWKGRQAVEQLSVTPPVEQLSVTPQIERLSKRVYWLYQAPSKDQLIVAGGLGLTVVDVAERPVRVINHHAQGGVSWVAASADGKLVAVAIGQEIQLLSVPDFEVVRIFRQRLSVEDANFRGVSGLSLDTLSTLSASGAWIDPMQVPQERATPPDPKRPPARPAKRKRRE